jgi:hypothetical protein
MSFSAVVRPGHPDFLGFPWELPLGPRLRSLAELGFDVGGVELIASGSDYRLRLNPLGVEAGHHSRRRATTARWRLASPGGRLSRPRR